MDARHTLQDRGDAPEPATAKPVNREPMNDEPVEQLIEYLEPDQLVVETFRPVTRAALTGNAAAGLWALRVFVVLVSLMVIYTFVARLH